MKKKLLALLIASLLFVSAFALTACKLTKITSIEWLEQPQTQFMLDSGDSFNFSIKVKYNNSEGDKEVKVTVVKNSSAKYEFTVDDSALEITFDLQNFDTSAAGSYTAVLSCSSTQIAVKVIKLNFKYTVVDNSISNLIADSNGNYLVSNAHEFTMIALGKHSSVPMSENYRLTSDIDFSILDSATKIAYEEAIYKNLFNGTLDGEKQTLNGTRTGQNYKILNYIPNSSNTINQWGLFYNFGSTVTFKNLDLVNCSIDNVAAEGTGLLGRGNTNESYPESMFTALPNKDKHASWFFENINLKNCSVKANKSSALLVAYAGGNLQVKFTNCNTDSDCLMTGGRDAGGLLGRNTDNKLNLNDGSKVPADLTATGALESFKELKQSKIPFIFENCHISATIQNNDPGTANQIGALMGQSSSSYNWGINNEKCYVPTYANNCTFDGKLVIPNAPATLPELVINPFFGNVSYGYHNLLVRNSNSSNATIVSKIAKNTLSDNVKKIYSDYDDFNALVTKPVSDNRRMTYEVVNGLVTTNGSTVSKSYRAVFAANLTEAEVNNTKTTNISSVKVGGEAKSRTVSSDGYLDTFSSIDGVTVDTAITNTSNSLIKFNLIPNATSYTISISGGLATNRHAISGGGSRYSFTKVFTQSDGENNIINTGLYIPKNVYVASKAPTSTTEIANNFDYYLINYPNDTYISSVSGEWYISISAYDKDGFIIAAYSKQIAAKERTLLTDAGASFATGFSLR